MRGVCKRGCGGCARGASKQKPTGSTHSKPRARERTGTPLKPPLPYPLAVPMKPHRDTHTRARGSSRRWGAGVRGLCGGARGRRGALGGSCGGVRGQASTRCRTHETTQGHAHARTGVKPKVGCGRAGVVRGGKGKAACLGVCKRACGGAGGKRAPAAAAAGSTHSKPRACEHTGTRTRTCGGVQAKAYWLYP